MSDEAAVLAPQLREQIRCFTAGGMDPEAAEKVLRGYFSGQRDGLRTYKFLEMRIQGNGGTFNAIGVDISRSGMLFRITDERFASENRSHPLMPYTARVWHNFEGGFRIHFDVADFSVAAEIVRVTGYSGREKSLILIGCRFDTQLTSGQCMQLGIAYSDDVRSQDKSGDPRIDGESLSS